MRYQFTSLLMLASLGACAAPVSSSDEATDEAVQAVTGLNPGQYRLTPSYASSECVSTASFNTANGGSGDIWTCATSGDPNWSIVQVSSGVYEIRQAGSGNCLTVAGGVLPFTAGTATSLWSCNGQVGSRWNVAQVGSNYTFESLNNNSMCLDVVKSASSDGTGMDIWNCSGAANQQFALTSSVSAAAVSAALAVTSSNASQYSVTITVKNSSNTAVSNWQVGLNLNQSSISQGAQYGGGAGLFGAEVVYSNGLAILTANGASLGAGASTQVSFTGNITGSNWTPTIANVDGIAGSSAPIQNDGIDHIARSAATAALNVMTTWESGRTTNGFVDLALLDSHSYVVSAGQMVFDTTSAAGSSASTSAVAALAAAQADPATASYLVSGLLSCFADSNPEYTYAFNAAALRSWSYTTTSQNVALSMASGFGTDNITRVGANVSGAEQIALTETVNSGSQDNYFGLVSTLGYGLIDSSSATSAKYHSGNGFPCSPFNGPGGSSNPYLIISVNGSSVGARQQLTALQCPTANHCTSTAVVDPVAYASPGQFYTGTNNLIGPSTNPFALDPNVVLGFNPDHQSQWAQDVSGNWGEFSKKTFYGGGYWYKWNMCAGGAYNANGC